MKKIKAFSLLETILSFAIISLIASTFSLIYLYISRQNFKQLNEIKFHYIRNAMQSYLLQHGRLPLASDDEFGISGKKHKGQVPYKTLGIPKDYIYDANHQFFIYIVNPLFTETNLNIQIPLSYNPAQNEKSFLRLYKHNNDGTLIYDDISTNQLIISENNINIIDANNDFYVMPPIKKFANLQSLNAWACNQLKNSEYKIHNLVVWILISYSKNSKNIQENYSFEINNVDHVFYQLRFDMAAQMDFYCSAEPIYHE